MTPADDYARAWAAMRRTELRGTHEAPCRFGTVALTPELPLRHDANFVYADALPAGATAAELAAETDHVLGAAGVRHRVVTVPDPAAGRLADGFRELGWQTQRHLVMAQRRSPERLVDTSTVVEVDEPTLRPVREAITRAQPWGTDEVARQLAAAKRLIRGTVRFFAVEVDGEIASCTDLYLSGRDGQVEDVATLEQHRGNGHASAVVVGAADEARRAGADFVFLCADAEDWPKELYRRLGFDDVGLYWKFLEV
jgi:N-acetylglutamate synthase-like GNAT family acetyltransferase